MSYVKAIFLPCVIFFAYGRFWSGIIALFFMIVGPFSLGATWLLASLWAITFAYSHRTDPNTKLLRESLYNLSDTIKKQGVSEGSNVTHHDATVDSFEEKWTYMKKYDEDVVAAIKRLEPYGEKAIKELKEAYRHLGHKKNIKEITDKIIEQHSYNEAST